MVASSAFWHSCLTVDSWLLGVPQVGYSDIGLSGGSICKTISEKWQTVTLCNMHTRHTRLYRHTFLPCGRWSQDSVGNPVAVHQGLLVATLVLQGDSHEASPPRNINGDGLDG